MHLLAAIVLLLVVLVLPLNSCHIINSKILAKQWKPCSKYDYCHYVMRNNLYLKLINTNLTENAPINHFNFHLPVSFKQAHFIIIPIKYRR